MNRNVRRLVVLTALLAGVILVLAGLRDLPTMTGQHLLIFLILVGLALLSHSLGVDVDQEGTRTSFDFIVILSAVPLLGPFGAGLVGGLGGLLYQVFATDKPAEKYIFNASQFAIAGACSGFVYTALGAEPSLQNLPFPGALLPFLAASVTEPLVNTLAVTAIISVAREVPWRHTVQELKGRLILFDVVFGLLGFGLAKLYVAVGPPWGSVALTIAVVPFIALRYFYGLNIQLRHLSRDLTRVLVRTIEAQDPYTSGHSVRVAEYARRIAQELGLGYNRTHRVETAALLHDIGKIDRAYRTILKQEGPLTDQQRELIEAHPDRGADLLDSVRALDEEVLRAIRHHHERYDGDGYPDGLEGEGIPISSRIIMVADTIDAMMTSRSYRDALDPQDVRRELWMLKGDQFDPDVVEAAFEAGIVEDAAEAHQEQQEEEGILERYS